MRADVEQKIALSFEEARRTTPSAPADSREGPLGGQIPGTFDASVYADPVRYEAELELLFRRQWNPICRAADVADEGRFVTFDLAGTPIVIVGQGGCDVRALVNVCRHRGAQILRKACGKVEALTCPYHAFRYDLGGSLVACPEPSSFREEARPGALSLPSLPVAQYGGWIWTSLDPKVGPLTEALGEELLDELFHWPLADCAVVDSRRIECDFDWKVGVEAFLEPLHLPTIHARSAHPVVDFRGMAARDLSPHSRMALPFRLENAFSADGLLGSVASAAGVLGFEKLNRVQRGAHFVYMLFPNTVLLLFPNHLLALRFVPAGLGLCDLHYELLALPPESESARAWLESLRPGYDQLLAEDIENLAWIQRGVRSGALPGIELSGFEVRIALFREALERRIQGA